MQPARCRSRWAALALAALLASSLPSAAAGAQPAGASVVEDFSQETVGADPTWFSTPVGFWTIAAEDGRPVLLEDGTRWEGSDVANALANQAKAVYGDRWAEFIDDLSETGYFPIALFNKVTTFTSGTLSLRFKVLGGNIDQDAGIVFNYQPNGDFMALRSDTQENNLLLYEWIGGQPRSLKRATDVPSLLSEWHEQQLVVTGTRVEGYLDGQKYLEADLGAPVSGMVGLWSKTDTVAIFDRFSVEPAP